MIPAAAKIRPVALLLCLALVTAVVYLPGIPGSFALDDFGNIVHNEQLHLSTLDPAALKDAAFSSSSGLLHRPVSMLSFALNHYLAGPEPLSFKLTNLFIHILNGIGLFFLTRLLLDAHRRLNAPDLGDRHLRLLLLWLTAAWLLHPINLTAVLYVVQRMASLSSLFMVAGLYCYVRGRVQRLAGRSGMGFMLSGVIGFGTLAILSKETGALLPLYMFIIELAVFRFRAADRGPDRTLIGLFVIVLALPALAVLALLAVDPSVFLAGYEGRNFTLAERLLTQARVLVFYLRMILLPQNSALGLYHDDIPVSRSLLDPVSTLAALGVLLSLLVAAVLLLRRHSVVALGLLWFFAGHLLESTILPLEIAYEHRNYLASYGILLAVGYLLLPGLANTTAPTVRYASAAAALALFALTTVLRAGQWQNDISHALTEAENHPDSARAVYSAGRVYANLVLRGKIEQPDQALYLLERAIALNSESLMPNAAAAVFCVRLGVSPCIDWYEDARQIVTTRPITAETVTTLRGLIDCTRKECAALAPRVGELLAAALHNPSVHSRPAAHADLLNLYGQHLMYLNNDFSAAEPLFRQAATTLPEDPQHRLNLARLLLAMGERDEAATQLHQVRALDGLGRFASEADRLERQLLPGNSHDQSGAHP